MKKLLAVAAVAASALLVVSAEAKTCVWTGAGANGKWTNPDNWKDGEIPGRITVSSVLSGEGGDIAEFGAVAAGAKTTIDMTGVTSIGGIKVIGADAPAYTFGTADVHFEADGFGYSVDAGVVNAPTIAKKYRIVYATTSTPVLTIRNESTDCVVNLPTIEKATTKDPEYTGSISLNYIDFRGAGDIRIAGAEAYGYGSCAWKLNQTGKLRIGCTMYPTTYGPLPPWDVIAGDVAPVSRIEVEEGFSFTTATQYGRSWVIEDSDLEISGKGTFGFHYNPVFDSNVTRVRIGTDRKLTISCNYEPLKDNVANPGFRAHNIGESKYTGGTWTFTGTNTTKGPAQNFYGTIETDRQGGFGFGELQMSAASVFRYFGEADWTMTQDVCVTNFPGRTTLTGKLETVADKGVWTLAGGISQHTSDSSGTGTITLQGDGEGVVTGVIANGAGARVLEIAKAGSGTWTLAGENTFTGATTVNAGTLKVAATGSLASSSGLTVNGGTVSFEGDEEPTAQTIQKLTISGSGTLAISGKVTVTAAAVSRTSGKVLDVVTDSMDAKLVVPAGTTAAAFTWNGQPAVIGDDGEVTIDADAIIAARGDVVPDNGGKVVIFNPGTTGNDTLEAGTTTLTKLTQMSKTAATVAFGEGRALLTPSVALVANAADLALGAAGDEGALDSPTKVISFDNQGDAGKITLNAAIGTGVTNEFAHGAAVIAGDTTLGFTKIAIVDKAKAQLEVRGCTVETGLEPINVGSNTGNNYNGGGTQYGELTVSNAVIRNAADLARTSHSYDKGSDYAIMVGKNAYGILRVQDGAVISNKLQIGTGGGGIPSTDASTGGRGSGAVYQSGGQVVTIGSAEYRANSMGSGSGMGYYELKAGTFAGYMSIGTYGYGIWHQEPGTTADLKSLTAASANGGHADVYIRGTVTARNASSQICGGYQSGNVSVVTVDGPGVLDCDNNIVYAFISSAVCTSRVNVVRGGTVKLANFYRHSNAPAAGCFGIAFDGGTVVCRSNAGDLFAYDANMEFVDDVRVYAGGMTVDTGDRSTGTKVPLRKPEERGVAAIPFDFTAFKSWNVPPFIRIDGDGDGATAHALFDSDSQSVTGVVITCSGTGYSWAKAKAVYSGIGPAGISVDCVLEDNDQSGSFTKAGTGTFTLRATNTWGGATIAAGGTLKAGCDWAVPTNSPVVLAGGKIDFGGKVGSVSKITYTVGGGSIVNAENVTLPSTFDLAITAEEVLAKKSIPLTGDQDLTGKTLTITGDFSSLDPEVCRKYTVVSVSGGTISGEPTIVAPALPKDWSFVTRPNGVKLVNPLGMMLLVR